MPQHEPHKPHKAYPKAPSTYTHKGKRKGRVNIKYRHRGIGAELVAAGILGGARVYADDYNTDPFTALPKPLRKIALAKFGVDFDDEASHPRAAVDLTEVGRDERIRFLQNRELIMKEVGETLWPEDDHTSHRPKVKQFFTAKDMGASTKAWCEEQNVEIETLLGVTVSTKGWDHLCEFTVGNYCKKIAEGLRDIENNYEDITAFIAEWKLSLIHI